MTTMIPDIPASDLASDLLCGAEAIAEFLYGDKRQRRKVYHLAETTRFPVFRLGSKLCARRSVVTKWIAWQEERAEPTKWRALFTDVPARVRPRAPTPPLNDGFQWDLDEPDAESNP